MSLSPDKGITSKRPNTLTDIVGLGAGGLADGSGGGTNPILTDNVGVDGVTDSGYSAILSSAIQLANSDGDFWRVTFGAIPNNSAADSKGAIASSLTNTGWNVNGSNATNASSLEIGGSVFEGAWGTWDGSARIDVQIIGKDEGSSSNISDVIVNGVNTTTTLPVAVTTANSLFEQFFALGGGTKTNSLVGILYILIQQADGTLHRFLIDEGAGNSVLQSETSALTATLSGVENTNWKWETITGQDFNSDWNDDFG